VHTHNKDCVWTTYPSGLQQCKTARNERDRARAAKGLMVRGGDPDRYRRQDPDGWEDEFGPVPLKVPRHEWYDRVIVERALTHESTGRKPYKLEWAEIVRRLPEARVTTTDVALATGVTQEYVADLVRCHG